MATKAYKGEILKRTPFFLQKQGCRHFHPGGLSLEQSSIHLEVPEVQDDRGEVEKFSA